MHSNQNLGIVNSIDADTIIYLVCYNLQNTEDVDECIKLIDDYIKLILNTTNSTFYVGFIGNGTTFRHVADPTYKSKRPSKPEWLSKWEGVVRHRLITHWKFIPVSNIEAEDAAIICANHFKRLDYNVVLSHVDKDLNFWEGNHFNYQKHEFYYSDKIGRLTLHKSKLKGTGLKYMYAQIICGDSTDNVPGLVGKGPTFAYNLLKDCNSAFGLLRRTYMAYMVHCKATDKREYLKLQIKLICMLSEPAYGFEIPELNTYIKEENRREELPFDL